MTARKATKETTATAQDAFGTFNTAFTEGFERMTSSFNNFGTFGQENVEAMVESATTVAKGVERVATENADFAKKQMETGTEKVQALAKVKTPQEFFEAQSELVRTAMEAQISQANKVSDMWVAMTRDAAQPLSKRYSAFVEMMQAR